MRCMQDEISTGLDSSTTYLITRCIRNFVHMQDATVLMALLQPAPETFNLFDDVMLLSEGGAAFSAALRMHACGQALAYRNSLLLYATLAIARS
jgi:ABC-type multidrug transport system ATPase subunit